MNVADFIFNIVGIFSFQYLYWRKLKEDFPSVVIFNSSFTIILLVLFGGIISVKFLPEWWFWLTFAGALLGVIFSLKKFKLYKYETVEAAVVGLLVWFDFFIFNNLLKYVKLSNLFTFIVVTLFIVLYFIFDKHYKKFNWYKSGRVGFSGLTIVGLFFLIRSCVALFTSDVISLVGNQTDIILSAAIAFFSFLLVYNLSKKSS